MPSENGVTAAKTFCRSIPDCAGIFYSLEVIKTVRFAVQSGKVA
jgi:hypothetical protein